MNNKRKTHRMNYVHKCQCGRTFHGYIHQNKCWSCISLYASYLLGKESNV